MSHPTEKLRLIQCGVGGFGEGWLKSHSSRSPDFDLVAIVDLSPAALEKSGAIAGIPPERRFATLEEALEKVEADAVLTVTPPPVHVLHARLAFARGLHVMTEKPLADTLENAREMIRLAQEAGKQLVVSQQYRFNPNIQKIRELVQGGTVGELGHGHLDFYIPGDFTGTFRERMEYPLLLDMAIHHFDLIRCITGLDIVKVTAASFRPGWSWYQHDSGLKLLIELEGGVQFSYSGDWSAFGRATPWAGNWRLQCAKGSLHMENEKVSLARCEYWGRTRIIEEIDLPGLDREGQAQTLFSFADAIRTGVPAETSGLNNFNSIAAVLGAMESAKTGHPVVLEKACCPAI